MDSMRVALKSKAIDLQSDAILEANRALAATENIQNPPKRSAECGLEIILRPFTLASDVVRSFISCHVQSTPPGSTSQVPHAPSSAHGGGGRVDSLRKCRGRYRFHPMSSPRYRAR